MLLEVKKATKEDKCSYTSAVRIHGYNEIKDLMGQATFQWKSKEQERSKMQEKNRLLV